MGFGDFLRGIAAQVNPFDNGQTYGTFNPPNKKKRQDQYNPAPAPSFSDFNAPRTQTPQNRFAGFTNPDLRLPSAPSTTTQPPQQQSGGFWHNLTHNPVTNVVGGIGKTVASPFVQFGKAAYYTPQAVYREIQNKPITDIQQKAFGTTDPTKIAEKIAGSTAGVGLTVLAPGASKLLEGTAARFLPETAPSVIRTIVPKAFAGANIGGAFNTAASVQAGDTKPSDLLKSFGLGAGTGGVLEGASPYLTRFLPSWLRRNRTATTDLSSESPIAGASAADAIQPLPPAPTTTKIPVSTGIDVNAPPSEPIRIPVRNENPPTPTGQFIRENSGDATRPGTMPTPQEIAARNFDNQPHPAPDPAIQGVKPTTPPQPFKLNDAQTKATQDAIVQDYANFLKDLGQGNGVSLVPDGEAYGYGRKRVSNNARPPGMSKGRITNQQWLDQALKDLQSGKAEPGHQQAFNDAANPEVQSLIAQGDQTPPPVGKPIVVKSVKGIPVTDQTVVPTDAGTPGTVRPTAATAPTTAKTEAVAANPTPATPAPVLSPDTQAILDNPKQFSKRQVAAARKQLRLAKQMAKIKSATQDVINQTPDLSQKPEGTPGFVPTGQLRKGVRGNVTESASKAAEAAQGAIDTSKLSVQDVLNKAQQEVAQAGHASPETIRNLKAMRDSGRFARTSEEFKALNTEYNNQISHYARGLSLTDRSARVSATGDQLTNRFVNKLLVFADTNKLTQEDINTVNAAEQAFTDARDTANTLAEQFKATGSQQDFNAWRTAQQAAEQADRQSKITEFQVSRRVLKGNKNPEALKAMQAAERNAGVYSMDAVDANMLSGTGTMVRNYINTLFPRMENRLFGKAASLAVRKIAPVGGSSWRGSRVGSKIGQQMFKADLSARKQGGIGFIRRTVTAGNTVGEANIKSTAFARGYDHYKQILRSDGYKGAELRNRAEFMARTDPQGLVQDYESQALQANALSSLTHSKKMENILADKTQKWLADSGFGARGQNAGRLTAKGVTRVAVGFPTVIGRSLVEGFKRATVGLPEAMWAGVKVAKGGSREVFAQDMAKAIQHAGSGASLILLGSALGKAGVITGAYPTDKAEQARWQAEGKQADSIRIGGQWFNIPGYLGGFALPLMLGASASNGNPTDAASLGNMWQTVLDASPVDNINSTIQIMTGRASGSKVKNAVTSLVRTATPAGSFLAELAKLTDSTKNDTTTKDALHNIFDNIAGGIPGVNNLVDKTPAMDAYGNVIKNPNPVATVFGAQGANQTQGTQDVNKAQSAADQTFTELQQYGVLADKNLMQLVDPKLAAQIANGDQLTPEQITSLQKSVTKGINATEDSNWREAGAYATDKAALQTKLQMLQADPTTKPSEIAAYKDQITRDNVLGQNNIPFNDFKLYKKTSLSDWRAMGDPKSDSYDPATYNKLWGLDQLFAKAGVSEKSSDMTKQKYSVKQLSASQRRIDTSFGKITQGAGAPRVQSYQSLDAASGSIPVIQRVIPNIVHKISSSG